MSSVKMTSLEESNTQEEICRTCLIDHGNFFNINDTFDHSTLTQMIKNITDLEMNPSDGYTQSICLECVKEVRSANKFRIKCLESNNTLTSVKIKALEVPISICKIELPEVKDIKQELEESCGNTEDYYLLCNLKYNENSCIKNKGQSDEDSENENKNDIKTIFDCPLCHGLFYSDSTYQKHIKEFHSNKIQEECFKQKQNTLGYVMKKKYLNKIKHLYKCILDDFFGNSFAEFRNHMKEHMGEKSIVCSECEFRTSEMPRLKFHRLQKHVQEKKFSCTFCEYSCQTQNALKIHLPIHTKEKNFKCQQCSLAFRRSSQMYVHKMVVHEKRKPHVCSVCQKAFTRKSSLRDHMLTHTGERPHICHYCGKGFSMAENMKTHITLQHEPIKTMFECDRCDYSTKRKTELKNHIKRHNGEKPFKCSQCSFSSLLKNALNVHMMRRHTGQKNYACDLCDYKALSPGVIKIHRRIHTGEKPHSCTICSYSTRTVQELKRHMQTHNTEKKFECPNCPFKTNVKINLSRHSRRNCLLKKRDRPSSKLLHIPDNVSKNNEIKNDTEESIEYYQTT